MCQGGGEGARSEKMVLGFERLRFPALGIQPCLFGYSAKNLFMQKVVSPFLFVVV